MLSTLSNSYIFKIFRGVTIQRFVNTRILKELKINFHVEIAPKFITFQHSIIHTTKFPQTNISRPLSTELNTFRI